MPTGSSCVRTAGQSASMPAAFGRDQTMFDPWHYVPVLARKPGAAAQRRAVQRLGAAARAGTGSAASWRGPRTATGRWWAS